MVERQEPGLAVHFAVGGDLPGDRVMVGAREGDAPQALDGTVVLHPDVKPAQGGPLGIVDVMPALDGRGEEATVRGVLIDEPCPNVVTHPEGGIEEGLIPLPGGSLIELSAKVFEQGIGVLREVLGDGRFSSVGSRRRGRNEAVGERHGTVGRREAVDRIIGRSRGDVALHAHPDVYLDRPKLGIRAVPKDVDPLLDLGMVEETQMNPAAGASLDDVGRLVP